jgi:enterochelin esterase-like enzyme
MKTQPLAGILKCLCLAGCLPLCAAAQAPTPPAAAPAPAPYASPEVHADRTATLRLRAPNAQSVEANLEGATLPMQKDPDGLWSVTTDVLAPEIYSYHFVVDGQSMLDPRNTDARSNLLSLSDNLTIPGTPPEAWELQSMPHGIVEHHYYTSHVVLGLPHDQSNYYVYLPPGYNPKAKQKYPVLYLLHGFSDAADGWYSVGKANFILDSLIAAGKAKPMIVVMTLGYGNMAVLTGPRNPELSEQNYDLYQKALVTEVIPQIEATYQVSKKREDRAIAGLSMGGHESLFTGLAHPDLFAWIGTFSAGLNAKAVSALPPTTPQKANLRLLWMACGVDDGLLKPNREVIAALKAEGLPVTAIETPGHHQWPVWRDNLIHFAPLLFQK